MTLSRRAEIEVRGDWCSSSGFLDSKVNCRNPDGCTCDEIARLNHDNFALEVKLAKAKEMLVLARAAVAISNTPAQLLFIPRIDSTLSEIADR